MRKIFLIGAVARQPELSYGNDGKARYNLTLAGQDNIVAHDGQERSLPWYHRVSEFGKMAEWLNERNYQAGDILAIDGDLSFSQTEGSEGKRNYINITPVSVDRLTGDFSGELISDASGGVRWNRGTNVVRIIGHVTQDPEVRYTPNGDAVVSINIANNQRWTDASGEKRERPHYFESTLWRELAEEAGRSLSKGSKAMITGRLMNETWTDKQGNKRNTTKIDANECVALDRPGNAEGAANARPAATRPAQSSGGARPAQASRPSAAAPQASRPTPSPAPKPVDLDDFPPEEEDLPF